MASVNEMGFNQLSAVLNAVAAQATGRENIQPITNTGDFISVAQTALKTGYDPLINSISQVLSRTIFSVRPYTRKLKGLEASEIRYGNHVRKLQVADKPFENDDRLLLEDGQSVDQYVVNKPLVLQTNFYGQNVYQKSYTLFKDQLDSAFSGPDEFARFVAMYVQNVQDMIEQCHETTARFTLANFIAGKNIGDTASVVHLLTEFNAATGQAYDSTTVMAPDVYPAFIKWAYARIKTSSQLMTERSVLNHINIDGKPIARHTPVSDQRLYVYAPDMNMIDTNVLTGVFNPEYMRMMEYEPLNYWQSIQTPGEIQIAPTYMTTTGALTTGDTQTMTNVFAVLFDVEAMGYTVVNQWSSPTPFNARGGYSNVYYHFTDRYWNDFTENGIVFLMD